MFASLFEKKSPLPLLLKENILLDCTASDKDEAIELVGGMLVKSGYVTPRYVQGMHTRELSFSTNLGNGMAIPHGENAVKNEIAYSGIVVAVFPDGINWNNTKVFIVVGIAGKDGEHLKILQNIARKLSTSEEVKEIVARHHVGSIYELLTR